MVGEYIDENANSITAGSGTRVCLLCDSDCRWCRYGPSQCLNCKDGHFLMDLYSQCRARFIDTGTSSCTNCQNSAYNTCDLAGFNSNRNCVTGCPNYLYFPIYRTGYSNSDYRSTQFSFYSSFMTGAS